MGRQRASWQQEHGLGQVRKDTRAGWGHAERVCVEQKCEPRPESQTEARLFGPMNAEESQILEETRGKLLKIFFEVEGLHEQTAIMG